MIRTLLVVLALVTAALGQDNTCHRCPTPAQMNLQFGPSVDELNSKPVKFWSKPYIFAETVHALAISTDAFITLKRENPKKCLEGNNGFPEFVHGPELAEEGAAEMGFGLFVRWMMTRERPPKAFRFISYMTPVWGTTVHVYGATKWYYQCR